MDYRDNLIMILRLDGELPADGQDHIFAVIGHSETSLPSDGEANPRWLEVRREGNERPGIWRTRYERDDRSAVWHRLCVVCEVGKLALKEDKDTNRLSAWLSVEINAGVNDRHHFVGGLYQKDPIGGAFRCLPMTPHPPVDTDMRVKLESFWITNGQPNCCSRKLARQENLATLEWHDAVPMSWRQCNDCYAGILTRPGLRLNVITAAHSAPPPLSA
jgi:hypothetical protein